MSRHPIRIAVSILCAIVLAMFVAACPANDVETPPASTARMADDAPHGIADWPEKFGNHRARIRVTEKADAVWVHIPWRRRDAMPADKEIMVVDAASNRRVENVYRVNIQREAGDLLFQPATAPGEYFVYYLPYKLSGNGYCPTTTYTAPTNTAGVGWTKTCAPLAKRVAAGDTAGIPAATVLEIQAINEFHRFDPMEVIATAQEMKTLLAAHAGEACLLFPEDRCYPIRMTNELPQRWIKAGPSDAFHGTAHRGEFYAFQIGVYATGQTLPNVRVSFAPLNSLQGSIPTEAMRCFNAGGTDWLGRPFLKQINVAGGRVQPLWIGVQVPKDASPGVFQGSVVIAANGIPDATVRLSLTVTDKLLADGGDSDLWRHARLRWLDSKIGLDDEVFQPYTPVAIGAQTVSVLGRRARFAADGLFDSIQSTFGYSVDNAAAPPREILAAAMRFVVETAAGPLAWHSGQPTVVSQSSGAVSWEATSKGDGMEMLCRAKMECDGYVNFRLTLRATRAAELKDLRLEIPLRREMSTYMMGLGCKGGRRPPQWQWKWDANRANNQLWIGEVNAAINLKLKHIDDRWDLYNLKESGMYRDWSNGGRGGCNVGETGQQVTVRAYTGPRKVAAGEELHFNFGLLITPVKTLDKGHWQSRYYHFYAPTVPVDTIAASGANVINCHQGNDLNPYINYPFLTTKAFAAYVAQAHAKGMKVKTYYTVRELSNYAAEFWALRSLGNEVFSDGPGFRVTDQFADKKAADANKPTGSSWLCEHAVTRYVAAWHQPYGNGQCDAAIATAGLSRWHNYYLEGLAWLIKNVGIDGLYLDGIGYDREIMKRLRKVTQHTRPGCLIDFHSGNNYSPEYGLNSCANQYMELFPFIDSLWFGEGFNYDEDPDYWLVEIAGIPYGLFGEMLQGGGNPWRGMIYGMTGRLGWGGNPQPMWKVWDAFGIQDARMIGYWDPACPVKTGRNDVLATTYVNRGKTLVAVASWTPQAVKCKLNIDWQVLGLDPAKAKLTAAEIKDFQTPAEFRPGDEVPVAPGRGWLLVIHE